MGGSVRTVKRNSESSLAAASRKIGLRANAKKTEDMTSSGDQHAGQKHCLKISNKSFERVEELTLETTLTNKKFDSRRNSEQILFRERFLSFSQKILSFTLLSKNIKFKIYRTIILSVVLYGCETCSLTLREELKLRVFENKVWRKVFGPKKGWVTGEWRRLHYEELCAPYSSPNIIRVIKSRIMSYLGHVACMKERIAAYSFGQGDLKKTDN